MSFKEIAALVIGLMAAGGVLTSYIEYRLSYNLWDKILDILHISKSAVSAAENAIKKP